MKIPHYLAMTAAEMDSAVSLPRHAAWMACHFSPYSTGLTNLPQQLPENSLLILNDRTPIRDHDPEQICGQLLDIIRRFTCCGLLMDFQNGGNMQTTALAQYLTENLPCPVGVTPGYRQDQAAVFLPPIPTDVPAAEYLKPWAGQKIWLETALEGQTIRLTEKGAAYTLNTKATGDNVHSDTALHCHYSICSGSDFAEFHTWRTSEDINSLLDEVQELGVENAVGLYQEFGTDN